MSDHVPFFAGGFFYDSRRHRILLHLRDAKTAKSPEQWAFFGGSSEGGESPVECFCREIREELGIRLSETDPEATREDLTFFLSRRVSARVEAGIERPTIGLRRGTVELRPYTAEWRRLFEEERTSLQSAIGQYVLDIQHVGSTAIPGMIAKPIIDIGIAVNDFDEAKVCISAIEQLGYEYRGELGIPRRHYFVKGDPRTHHIHMNEIESRDWKDQVLFRDYLIQHPELAEEYAQLKTALAQQFPTDREAYLDGKASFIDRVLRTARGDLGPMS